jgi:hypothetical protein
MDLIKIEKERPNSFRLGIGNLKNLHFFESESKVY